MTTGPVIDLATFASLLRGRGLTVTPEQVSDMARAVMLIDAAEESQVRASLRALTVSDPMQVPIFDDEFTRFFSGWAPGESAGGHRSQLAAASAMRPVLQQLDQLPSLDSESTQGTSAIQNIAARDFADPGEDPLNLTVSIGLAAFPDDRVQGAEGFVALADQALYRAKNEGRNLVRE